MSSRSAAGPLAFVFSSQGGQWPGMGIELSQADPIFRGTLQRCSVAVMRHLGVSLTAILGGDVSVGDRSALIQPMVTAIQLALVDALANRGVVAGGVIGLSMGEVAAAYAVDAMTIEEAMAVACAGAITLRGWPETGRMAAVSAGPAGVEPIIGDLPRVWAAVELSPTSTILSGRDGDVDEALDRCVALGIPFMPRTMPFAFHTPELDGVRTRFVAEMTPVAPRPSSAPFYSSVTGGPIATTELVVDYWSRMFTEPAPFTAAVDAMTADGFDTFVEVGPHPILASAVGETARTYRHRSVAVHASMSRDDGGSRLHELARAVSPGDGLRRDPAG